MAFLKFVDGPAEEERVHIGIPPQPVRWFCQCPELGSDELQSWWALEEPPEDPSVTVTRYELIEDEYLYNAVDDEETYCYRVAQEEETGLERDWEAIDLLVKEAADIERGVAKGEDDVAALTVASNFRLRAICLQMGMQSGPDEDLKGLQNNEEGEASDG